MLPYDDDLKNKSIGDMTILLIFTCVVVFGWQNYLYNVGGLEAWINWALVPDKLLHHFDLSALLTLFTAMFLHSGWQHLVTNMVCLYLFGRGVENKMGFLPFLGFYLLCGLSANIIYVLFNTSSNIACVGASGAIFGVMGAYLLFGPGAKIKVWMGLQVGTVEMPAYILMFIFMFINIAMAWITNVMGRVAAIGYAAHIGGFIIGMVLATFFDRRTKSE